MKSLKLFVAGMFLFLAIAVQAQVSVSVNVGSPPAWGPAGYNDAGYYYLPDVESFYDVHSSTFIYYEGGTWVHRTYLPRRFRNYDLYGGYKVVMTDYHGNAPYTHFNDYKMKYKKGYHGQAQKNNGVRPGKGNFKAKTVSNGQQNNKVSPGNGKSNGPGNNKDMNKGNGHGNGKGNKNK